MGPVWNHMEPHGTSHGTTWNHTGIAWNQSKKGQNVYHKFCVIRYTDEVVTDQMVKWYVDCSLSHPSPFYSNVTESLYDCDTLVCSLTRHLLEVRVHYENITMHEEEHIL